MTVIRSAANVLPDYFLSWSDVIAATGKSEMTIRRAIKRNDFPAPVKLFGHQSISLISKSKRPFEKSWIQREARCTWI